MTQPTYKDIIMTTPNFKLIEINKFIDHLYLIEKCKNKNDANKIISSIMPNINDNAQINTLTRILNENFKDKIIVNNKYSCPHCNRKNNNDSDDEYVICGYTCRGYDWYGCGKDWCGICNKKLCKHWANDSLYNKFNRIHNNKCCKKHAEKNGCDYLTEYCQCIHKYYKK